MATLNDIYNKFGMDFKETDGEKPHLRYCCQFCEDKIGKADKDYKLYINIQNNRSFGKFYCFKCHSRGSLETNNESYYGVYDNLGRYLESYKNNVDEEESNMFYVGNARIVKDSMAYNYCISRDITDELIQYYNIRVGTGDLFGRVVIPNTLFGGSSGVWTDMFSSRTYIDQIPKYLNPSGATKTGAVFNINNIKSGGDMFINEGAITSICAGKESVAVYGCHPSKNQISSIVNKNSQNYYCTLDGDEAGRDENVRLAETLSKKLVGNSVVYLVNMPSDKDASDLGSKLYKEYVMDNRILHYSAVYTKLMSFKYSK